MKNFISILTLSLFVSINAFAQFGILTPELKTSAGSFTSTYTVEGDNFFTDSAIRKSIKIDIPGATKIRINVTIDVEVKERNENADCYDVAGIYAYVLNENGQEVYGGNYGEYDCANLYTGGPYGGSITVDNGSITLIGLEQEDYLGGAISSAKYTVSYSVDY